jgi:hypothetical protein
VRNCHEPASNESTSRGTPISVKMLAQEMNCKTVFFAVAAHIQCFRTMKRSYFAKDEWLFS